MMSNAVVRTYELSEVKAMLRDAASHAKDRHELIADGERRPDDSRWGPMLKDLRNRTIVSGNTSSGFQNCQEQAVLHALNGSEGQKSLKVLCMTHVKFVFLRVGLAGTYFRAHGFFAADAEIDAHGKRVFNARPGEKYPRPRTGPAEAIGIKLLLRSETSLGIVTAYPHLSLGAGERLGAEFTSTRKPGLFFIPAPDLLAMSAEAAVDRAMGEEGA